MLNHKCSTMQIIFLATTPTGLFSLIIISKQTTDESMLSGHVPLSKKIKGVKIALSLKKLVRKRVKSGN